MQSRGRWISCSDRPYSATKTWHCSKVTDIPVLSLALLQLVNRSPTESVNKMLKKKKKKPFMSCSHNTPTFSTDFQPQWNKIFFSGNCRNSSSEHPLLHCTHSSKLNNCLGAARLEATISLSSICGKMGTVFYVFLTHLISSIHKK